MLNDNEVSYWKGDTSDPLQTLTIGQLVDNSADRFADRIAILVHKGEKLTYRQVQEQTDTLAAALIALGLNQGDHVAIWGFNTIEWYLSFLATMKAGLVGVNVNPVYERLELESCLQLSDAKILIIDENTNDHNRYEILQKIVPEIQEADYNIRIKSKTLPLLEIIIVISEKSYRGSYQWSNLFTIPEEEHFQRVAALRSEINVFDVCDIQFTSGTTNQPKGVLLTHHNLVNNGVLIGRNLLLGSKYHRPCIPIPFFHAYGLAAGIMASIFYGVTLILPYFKYSPTKTVECIIAEKCTLIYGTPTMYIDMLTILRQKLKEDPQTLEKMSSLERFYTGGASCLPEVIVKLRTDFKKTKISAGYGMTEMSPTTLMSLPNEPEELVLSTVGRVLDHVEAKVIDENGTIVPLNTSGEMCFRGHMVMKGYYKNEEKTKAVLDADGWFHTGDRFIMKENGYAQIVGRIKETIIRGGENIEPKEIEEVIIQHPNVIDVQVYGVSDSRLGEVIAASILTIDNSSITEEDIRNICKGNIANYKIPKYIIFCKDYPRTASGKIQKYKLRNELEEKLKQDKSQ